MKTCPDIDINESNIHEFSKYIVKRFNVLIDELIDYGILITHPEDNDNIGVSKMFINSYELAYNVGMSNVSAINIVLKDIYEVNDFYARGEYCFILMILNSRKYTRMCSNDY